MLNFCSFGFQSLEYDPIFYQGLVEIVSFASHHCDAIVVSVYVRS